eukprot:TRINITY_DN1559_c0_g2_i2.p1 TRINITY_DN1559_c0_g2~~TRINITY_DN1559_c0_g2_i2.p1  ORF type:complete len:370 (-),score=99.64 TRINITY_DN1559_c0_g2_i2:48-1157(-)
MCIRDRYGRILASGSGSIAYGAASNGKIEATRAGGFAGGFVVAGDMAADGEGSFSYGVAESGGFLHAADAAAYVQGFTREYGLLDAHGVASRVMGFAEEGKIFTDGPATYAFGYVSGNSLVSAVGIGSTAFGVANTEGKIMASGSGVASGIAENNSSISSSNGSVVFGKARDGFDVAGMGDSFVAAAARNRDVVADDAIALGFDVQATEPQQTVLGMCNEASAEGDGFVFTVGIGACEADTNGCSGLVLTDQGNLYVAGKVVQMDSDCLDYAAIRDAEGKTKRNIGQEEHTALQARLEKFKRENERLLSLIVTERKEKLKADNERWEKKRAEMTARMAKMLEKERAETRKETDRLRAKVEAATKKESKR